MKIHQFVDYHARITPENACLIFADQPISYAEIQRQSESIAAGLLERGIEAGDRIACLCQNCPEFLTLLVACSRVEAVLCAVNYRLAPEEVQYVLDDSNARMLAAPDTDMAPLIASLKTSVPILSSHDGSWEAWCRSLPDAAGIDRSRGSDAAIMQLYTSGTTGRPKGVVLSQRNIFSLYASAAASWSVKACPGSRDLVSAPNFHIGGAGTLILPILSGGTVVLHKTFDPFKVAEDLERYQIENTFVVPAMIMAMIHMVPDLGERNFSHLRQIVYGASPINSALLQSALKVFDCDFYQVYGMTETCGAVVSLSAEDHRRAGQDRPELLASCGRPQAGIDVKVVNDQGEQLGVGETGELLVRCDANMMGYYRRTEATEETLHDGWIHTGDSAFIDDEGYIFLRDRIKDMIISGGENIYPIEIENALSQHPAVADVAVVGIPCENYGEAPLACVVLKEGQSLDADEMVAFLRDSLAGYKIPRQIAHHAELPRNPSGKILKKHLREPYWQGHERAIG